MNAGQFFVSLRKMASHFAQLPGFWCIFCIIDANDRSFAVIQGIVKCTRLCFDGAAWHVDRGYLGWEPGVREGLGCGDVIAFHH